MFSRLIDAVSFLRDAAILARSRRPEDVKRYFEG